MKQVQYISQNTSIKQLLLILQPRFLDLMRQSQQKTSAFLICRSILEASMANSVDPEQTAPKGAVCSGFTLLASILN